ncbi:MAG: GNAT family N-acetyltransferase [Anaerolineales bacterium]|nr:GNAT family N-acetyltransferase [Anaerolineales bacterium]
MALKRSGGWLLRRKIAGFDYEDAMWPYPIFSCQDWGALRTDLNELESSLVCVSLVTDPFGCYDVTLLEHNFGDIVIPFKKHFVVDLSKPLESIVEPHHRRNARKAIKVLQVEECENAADHLDEWVELYNTLIERHSIKGIAAFSRRSFTAQLKVPGMVAFRALHEGKTVGMLLWYVQNKLGYYHLGAYSPQGYELRASFALFWTAINHFSSSGLNWLNLGAGAGSQNDGQDGLTRFKRGWSTETRTAYFCGRIFDQEKYQEIVRAKNIPPTSFFPAYRLGEF